MLEHCVNVSFACTYQYNVIVFLVKIVTVCCRCANRIQTELKPQIYLYLDVYQRHFKDRMIRDLVYLGNILIFPLMKKHFFVLC